MLPLAVSTFKFAGPVSWTFGALFVGWFYRVELHAAQYATIAFAAIFLAFAAPGVPRGAFLMLAPLFLAIGLPVEGHRHSHRGRRDSRSLRHGAQRQRRPGRGGARGALLDEGGLTVMSRSLSGSPRGTFNLRAVPTTCEVVTKGRALPTGH